MSSTVSLGGILVAALLLFSVYSGAEVRTWTSSDGSRVEAEFLSSSGGEVTIRRVKDGRQFTIPLDRLSEADREWVAHREVAAAEEAKAAKSEKTGSLVQVPAESEGLIRLPLRVYIISGIEMKQKGVRMTNWVTPKEVEEVLVPEINRIWKPAGIEFALESIVEREAVEIPDREEAITYILNAKRDAQGKSDPDRMPKIKALCDGGSRHPVINNLYLFPYLGQTSQGNAAMRGNVAYVGVWTDKPSRGERRPEKFQLKERGDFEIGSVARTSAHELGHNLGLVHPVPATQTRFDRVMGGKSPGYTFVEEEIALAREVALIRARKVLEWVEKEEKGSR